MAQALAYYPVSLYIPAFTTAVGLSTLSGTIALSVFNLSGVIGEPRISFALLPQSMVMHTDAVIWYDAPQI